MPARNAQNPIKSGKTFSPSGLPREGGRTSEHHGGGTPKCPACQTPVVLKPGFRLSSMKCAKCGAPLGKK